MYFLLCSKNARMIFKNFEKSFPTNVIFGPHLPPILCFFVCSALLAQTTCLIPFLEDDPYSYTDLKKNLVKIDQWGQEIQATKYSNCTILPLVAEIQNALFLVDLCKISV